MKARQIFDHTGTYQTDHNCGDSVNGCTTFGQDSERFNTDVQPGEAIRSSLTPGKDPALMHI